MNLIGNRIKSKRELKYESGTYYDNHKFTGKEEDGTLLYYFGARYYDKSIGRLISPDPASYPSDLNLNDPQTLNPYVYCTNNPLKYIDQNGEWRTYVDPLWGAYIEQQTMGGAITEVGLSLIPGADLAIVASRALHGDITVTGEDWGYAAIGTFASFLGQGLTAKGMQGVVQAATTARSFTSIGEAWQDK